MKRLMILFFSLFTLVGCSIKYDLDLTEPNTVNEQMEILEEDNSDEYFDTLKNYNGNIRTIYSEEDPDNFEKDPDLDYYNVENNSDDNVADLKINYMFDSEEFSSSNIINSCYENINFINNDKYVDISTSSKFLCFKKYITAREVEINIKTDKKITEHNADKVNGNTYTWLLNRTNAYNKPIRLSSVTKGKEEKEENTKFNLIVILSVIGGFLILIFSLIIYKKHKYNSN